VSNELNIPLATPGIAQRISALVRGKLTPLFYAGSSIVTALAQLVAGFLIIKWIVPGELGLWQSVRMAQIYAFLLLAGINNGLSRELPFFLGKGEQSFAERLAGTAFFCTTIASGIVFIGGACMVLIFFHSGPAVIAAIFAITAVIAFSFYQNILLVTFRSNDSFEKLTTIKFVEAALTLGTIPMVYYFTYNGMLARNVLINGAVCLMMYVRRPMRVRAVWDWQAVKLLLKTGLPIFGLDYAKNSASTLDRVVLLKIGGTREVGVYQLAGIALQTLAALPTSLASYLYPRMTYRYGQDGDRRALWRTGIKFVLLATVLTTIPAVFAAFMIPRVVPIYAPKYAGGIHAAQIVLVAGVFEAVNIIANALWSMKSWKLMVHYQVLSAVLFLLGPIMGCLLIGKSLEGVAWGMAIGSLCRGVGALGLTYWGTHVKGFSVKSTTSVTEVHAAR